MKFAKKKFTWASLGILLMFGAFPVHADWLNGLSIAQTFSGLPSANTVDDVVLNVMMWLLSIFTIIAVIGFIISGLMYIFAGSNTGLAEKAKNGFVFGIIGTTIGIAGYIIIAQIDELLAF